MLDTSQVYCFLPWKNHSPQIYVVPLKSNWHNWNMHRIEPLTIFCISHVGSRHGAKIYLLFQNNFFSALDNIHKSLPSNNMRQPSKVHIVRHYPESSTAGDLKKTNFLSHGVWDTYLYVDNLFSKCSKFFCLSKYWKYKLAFRVPFGTKVLGINGASWLHCLAMYKHMS